MRTINITHAVLSPLPVGGYNVDISVRYGTTGPFIPVGSNLAVLHSTALVVPLSISVDETINPSVQVKVINADCPSSTPYLESFTTT